MAGRTVALYLIRHGLAEARGRAWPDDSRRPLSAEGVGRMRRAARGLVRLGVELDVVLTSPLVRARQTADIVAEAFDPAVPVVVTDALTPRATAAALDAALAAHAGVAHLALVGHEPDLGRLAARLVGAPGAWPLKKGGVCRIDLVALPPVAPGVLRWFAIPRLLRSFGRP